MGWALRGNARARDALHKNLPFKISVITYMEIVQGMKNTAELRVFVKQLRNWQIQVIQLVSRNGRNDKTTTTEGAEVRGENTNQACLASSVTLRVLSGSLRHFLNYGRLDRRVSFRAMEWVEKFYLSHSLELADALIAATVVEAGERLLTANDKHYRQIKEIQIERFRP